MAEEQLLSIKLPNITSDDAKLKTLEARLVGPSKDGLPPIQSTENINVENIKTSKSFFSNLTDLLELSNINENDENVEKFIDKNNKMINLSNEEIYSERKLKDNFDLGFIDKDTANIDLNQNFRNDFFVSDNQIENNNLLTYNSNKSINLNSKRKCARPEKAELHKKEYNNQQVNYLSTKRQKPKTKDNFKNPNSINISKEIDLDYFKDTDTPRRVLFSPPGNTHEKEVHRNSIKQNKKSKIVSKIELGEEIINVNNTNTEESENSDLNDLEAKNNYIELKEEEMISSKYNNKEFFDKKAKQNFNIKSFNNNTTVNTINNIYNSTDMRSNSNIDNLISFSTQIMISGADAKRQRNNNTVLSQNSVTSQNNNINININELTGKTVQNKNYENKINNYFKQSNSSSKDVKNTSTAIKGSSSNIVNSVEYALIVEELNKLKQENEDLKRKKVDKELEYNNLKYNYDHILVDLNNLKNDLDIAIEAKDRATESLVIYLRELEEMKRAKQKEWVNNQSFKIGKFRTQSTGMTLTQIWEDGVEIKQIKAELDEVKRQKEENKTKKKSINYDKLEVHKFKNEMLNKQEADLNEKILKLYKDRIILEAEEKRLSEENKCNYSNKNWPILNNRYLILSLIGKGGYSEVYKAYDLVAHINVACKIHQLDTTWSENIKELYIRHTIRENQIHQRINHEKVVKHYDTVEIDNNSFATVLELCTGPDLSYYLKKNGFLSERESKIIIKQIVIGLKELHSLGIIHYDLKPQNIIFHKGEVKISDFGLAKEMSDKEKIELTCLGVGTYYYLPPETFDPNRNSLIDQKVDIWSVGVIFYELLYGKKPFGNNMSQDRIFKENLIWNSKPLEFPTDSKINITKETQVSLFLNNFIRNLLNDVYQRMLITDILHRWLMMH
jgi:tousled-like kinase